ncbi:MAG: pyridoxal-phosphate dependent enzyme [Deltaproteobacteria bacterium]|nr:pyridoxal-phosphate dependent enzyme [Deltaproteobacteria bacterium]
MPKEFKGVLPDILACVGDTPLVRLNKVVGNCASAIAAKLEFMNPGGSVKDRIGFYIIEQAEKRGELKPGGTIVEATSGNTGMALAMAGAIKGYKLIFVIPDKMSKEKINTLRAFGAKVVVTPTNVEPEDPRSYYSVAKRLAEVTPNAFYANQYHNPDNPEAHYKMTGPEIWEQTQGTIDALVLGVGTGGTMTGVARYLKKKKKEINIIGVDPEGSIFFDHFHHKKKITPHTYLIEGIGEDFFPSTANLTLLTHMIRVEDKAAYQMARALLIKEGIFTGSSGGAAVAGAIRYANTLKDPQNIVVILPDSGSRYLTKLFNDQWIQDQGLWEGISKTYGVAEDLIHKRFDRGEVVVAIIKDTIGQAIDKMSKGGISQLPVMDGNQIIGLVTESDILAPLAKGEVAATDSVTIIMKTDLRTLDAHENMDSLLKVFEKNEIAIIKKHGDFLGLVTKIDFIKFLGQ